MTVKRVQEHLSRWLVLYVVAVMGLGIGLGWPARSWATAHQGMLSTLTTVAVPLIIYPMMVNVRFGALTRAGRNLKGLGLALGYNFVWAPLLGLGLAHVFLGNPMLALGFLLVMVVPCSSMSIAYTGLAEGDLELATVVVAVSFLLSIAVVPLWMTVFAAGYQVPMPISQLLLSIVEVLIGPMVAGALTRVALVRWRGQAFVGRLQPLFASMSLVMMFVIIFLIFFGKADMIVGKWSTVLLLLVPNFLFVAITLAVVTLVDRLLHLSYREHMAVVFAATGKNNGTAIAIASMAFSAMVAIPAATLPIFQVVLLVLYLKAAGAVRRLFRAPVVVAGGSSDVRATTAA
jgi:ACR3 family arsenite efflux pump ArsB